MPKIGMKNLRYAKVTVTEDESGAETETFGTVKKLGRVVSDDVSINLDKFQFSPPREGRLTEEMKNEIAEIFQFSPPREGRPGAVL